MPRVDVPEELQQSLFCSCIDFRTDLAVKHPGGPLAYVLDKCSLPASAAKEWCLTTTFGKEVTAQELASDRYSLLRLLRQDQVATVNDMIDLTGDDPAGPSSAGQRLGLVACKPRRNFMRFLGANMSVLDAILELVDNSVAALDPNSGLPPSQPREVWLSFVDTSGELEFHVRDTGCGMSMKGVEKWGTLGSDNQPGSSAEADAAQAAVLLPGAGETEPHAAVPARLGHWAVGAKVAAVTLTSQGPQKEGIARVTSLKAGKIASLTLDCNPPAGTAAATGGAGEEREREWWDYPGEERIPRGDVETGKAPAPGGGTWAAFGTLVEVLGCEPGLVELYRECEEAAAERRTSKLAKLLAGTYRPFLHPHLVGDAAGPAFPALPRSAAGLTDAKELIAKPKGKQAKAAGKAKAVAAPSAPAPPPQPLLRMFVQMRDVATVEDDCLSLLYKKPASTGAESLHVRLAVTFDKTPHLTSVCHLTVVYHPFVDGGETRPPELRDEYDVAPGSAVITRCGRTLQKGGKPARVALPWLRGAWSREGKEKVRMEKGTDRRLETRTSAVLHCDPSWAPTNDKSALLPEGPLTKVLAALCDGCANEKSEKDALARLGARVTMSLASPAFPGPPAWAEFDSQVLREAVVRHIEHCHKELDKEAGVYQPDGAETAIGWTLVPTSLPKEAVRAFEHVEASLGSPGTPLFMVTLRTGLQLGPDRIAAPVLPTAANQVRLLIPRRGGHQPKDPGLDGCPKVDGKEHPGLLCTLRGVLTRGGPLHDAVRGEEIAVLDHWTADADAVKGLALTGDSGGFAWRSYSPRQEDQDALRSQLLQLGRCTLRPVRDVMDAKRLSPEEWAAAVAERRAALPARIATAPQWRAQGKRADGSTAYGVGPALQQGMRLPAGSSLGDFLAMCVLRSEDHIPVMARKSKIEGEEQDPKLFWAGGARMRLHITRKGEGKDKDVVQELSAVPWAPDKTDKAKEKLPPGLYFFEKVHFSVPGKYKLVFGLEGNTDGVVVHPLMFNVTVDAPRELAPLNPQGRWAVCCHAGDCVGVEEKKGIRTGCQLLNEHLANNSLQLHGGTTGKLYATQWLERIKGQHKETVPCAWPDVLSSHDVVLSLWTTLTGKSEKPLEGVEVNQEVSCLMQRDGFELVLGGIRLGGGKLPLGADAWALDGNANNRDRAPGKPYHAILRVTLVPKQPAKGAASQGAASDGRLTTEIEINIAPGPLAKLEPADGSELKTWGKDLAAGSEVEFSVRLLDKSGNLTESPPENAKGLDIRLAVVKGLETISEPKWENGIATFRVRVTAEAGQEYSATVGTTGSTVAKLLLSGTVPTRSLKVLNPPAQGALTGLAGGELTGLSTVRVAVVKKTSRRTQPDPGYQCELLAREAPPAPGTTTHKPGSKAAKWKSDWDEALSDFEVALPGDDPPSGVALSPVTLPTKAGKRTLELYVRGAERNDQLKARLEVTVAPGPASRLALVGDAPSCASGGTVQLLCSAVDEYNNEAELEEEVLRSFNISSRDGDALSLRLVRVERDGLGTAVLTVEMAGVAPGTSSVCAQAILRGETVACDWHVHLHPGAADAGNSTVELAGAEEEDGEWCIAQGAPFAAVAILRDASGNPGAQPPTGATMAMQPHPHVVAPGPQPVPEPPNTARIDCRLSPATPLGPMELKLVIGSLQLPLRLRVLPGQLAAALEWAEGTAPVEVDAGTSFNPGRVRARTASGSVPQPLPSLLLRMVPPPGAAPQQLGQFETRLRHLGGGDFGLPDGALPAPERTGEYSLVCVCEGDEPPGLSTSRPLHVTPLTNDPERPPRLCLADQERQFPPGKLVRGDPGVGAKLADVLDFYLCDFFWNPIDTETMGRVGLQLYREGEPSAPLEEPFKREDEPGPSKEARMRKGIIRFEHVTLDAKYPSGSYFLQAAPRRECEWWTRSGGVSHAVPFEYQDSAATAAAEAAAQAKASAAARLREATLAADTAGVQLRQGRDALGTLRTAVQARAEDVRVARQALDEHLKEPRPRRLMDEAGRGLTYTRNYKEPEYVPRYRSRGCASREGHLGLVVDFLAVEGSDVADVLYKAMGPKQLLLAVVRKTATMRALRQELGETLVATDIEENMAAQRKFWAGAVDAAHPQKLLKLPEINSPGFVGYLVNLVYLSPAGLSLRVAVRSEQDWAEACKRLHGSKPLKKPTSLGLRESLLYFLLGNKIVFDTEAHLMAHRAQHGVGAGAYPLDGCHVDANGIFYGSRATPPATILLPVLGPRQRVGPPLRQDVGLADVWGRQEVQLRAQLSDAEKDEAAKRKEADKAEKALAKLEQAKQQADQAKEQAQLALNDAARAAEAAGATRGRRSGEGVDNPRSAKRARKA